jgi:hypothetical protein
MKTRVKHVALFSPLLLALAGGCVTKALWENGNLEACSEPADKLNLRLFQGAPQTNLLVLYDECSERNDAVHTRAYWLKENQTLVEQHVRPHFTAASSKHYLPVVPVFYDPIPAGMNLPPGLCAVVATNRHSFTLYQANRAIASHDLPVYNDGKGRIEKIALTPIAVAGDLTVVGGCIAYLYLSSYSETANDGGYVPIYLPISHH